MKTMLSMQKLQRLGNVTRFVGFKGMPLIIYAFFMLIYYSVLLKSASIEDIAAKISRIRQAKPGGNSSNNLPAPVAIDNPPAAMDNPPTAMDNSLAAMDKLYIVCSGILRYIFFTKRPCLKRSLVLHHWCLSKGIDSTLIIGVRKENSRLLSHAWIELKGRPYRENIDALSAFSPIFKG